MIEWSEFFKRQTPEDREMNLALHVALDAPGLWDELVHITDPEMGYSDELRLAAEYMMSRTPNEIEQIGWRVLEDDNLWIAINRAVRSTIIEVATELQGTPTPMPVVVSSGDGKTEA